MINILLHKNAKSASLHFRLNFLLIKASGSYFCLCYLIFLPFLSFAQTDCPTCPSTQTEGFVIAPASKVACDSVTICVKNCFPGAVNISYDFNNDGNRVNDTIFTYTEPGIYPIAQFAQVNDGSGPRLEISHDTIVVFPTPEPGFIVESLCADNQVFLTITDTVYQQYLINWGDNSPLEVVPDGVTNVSHQYSINRTYPISVIGNYVPGGCGDTTTVLVSTIQSVFPPNVNSIQTDSVSVSTGEVSINIDTDSNFIYQFFRENSSVLLGEVNGTGSALTTTLSSLNTTSTNCFRVRTRDNCNEMVDSDAIYCSLGLRVRAEDNQNQVRWTPYPSLNSTITSGFQQYILYRNSQPYQIITDINVDEFIDLDVVCNVSYCYKIEAIFNSLELDFTSSSNTDCINAFSSASPPAVTNLNATVETFRSIRLFWELPESTEVDFYTIVGPDESTQINTDSRQVIVEDLQIDGQICYRVSYQDECGNASEATFRTCPVFLTVQSSGDGQVTLDWTEYENSNNFFEGYIVEKLDDQGEIYEEFSTGLINGFRDPNAKGDRQILRYRIKTWINQANNIFSYSNVVEVRQDFRIFFPNAFSPNGDNLNEIFKPTYLFVKDFEMRIFSRAGELLFTSNNIEDGWDGNFKGQQAQQGAYVYLVKLEDFTGEVFNTQGTFTLIR